MTIIVRPRPEVGRCQRVFTTAWQLAGLLVGIESYYQVHDGTVLGIVSRNCGKVPSLHLRRISTSTLNLLKNMFSQMFIVRLET